MTIRNKKYTSFDFVAIPMTAAPVFASLRILDKIIYALIPSLQILATANFIDTAVDIFNNGGGVSRIYLPLALLLLIIGHQYINYALMGFVKTKLDMKLTEHFRTAVVEKRARLEYRHIEDNETWELLNRTCEDPAKKITQGFDILLRMADMVIRIASILLILVTQVWWAALVIIAFSVPLFYIALKSGKSNYKASKDAAKHQRKAKYLQSVISGRENAEERALFSYTDEINKKWYEKYETARIINMRMQTKNYIRMKGASLITLLISVLITGVLLTPLSTGAITIGMFMGLVNATFSLVQLVSWELAYVTSELAHNREYLKDLTAFSELSETLDAVSLPVYPDKGFNSLEFRNVSFRYPGTEKYILKNLSMRLDAKKHYAFVGVNGAGKTTITKLLTGLYTNYEGEILIDGRELKNCGAAELKGMFAVVYQDFAKYYVSLKDNITLGNVRGVSGGAVQDAIETIGLGETVKKLGNGIETPLGKIKEGGSDLSGGEWQRLAIARSLVSGAAVHILDEPTAALDPMAESGIYEMFGKISAGRSAIFITHRLGAAKLADEILVIEDGRVYEKGSHDELMARGGIYADMFESQRSWYK